jgi:hypothetical protein
MRAKVVVATMAIGIGFLVAATPPGFAFSSNSQGNTGYPIHTQANTGNHIGWYATPPYTGGTLPPGYNSPGVKQGFDGNPVPLTQSPGWSNGQKTGWSTGAPAGQ